MHEGFKAVQVFLGIKFGLLAYAVCNTNDDKFLQFIEVSKWFTSSRLYPDLDFKTGTSLSVCICHSIATCTLKFSYQWLVGAFYKKNALTTLPITKC